ncbi:hypothetical protein CR513_08274, partial [Mucuna pruriens]
MELKPLPSHLKYTYLDTEQQLPVIIGNNLHQEQEDKLLLILMEEEAKPIRKQQRSMNSTILDVIKKEVTKLLVVGIIYPI